MKTLFLLILGNLLSISLITQTPPARTWYFNKNGQKTTVRERWMENSEGLKHGSYISYFPSGERRTYGLYSLGKKEGKWEQVPTDNFSAKILEVSHWKNGLCSGQYTVTKDGKVTDQGIFVQGEKSGQWVEKYSLAENVYQAGFYKEGMREGKWINTFKKYVPSTDALMELSLDDYLTETKKGFYSFYTEGKCTASYDPNGINLWKDENKQKEKEEEKE